MASSPDADIVALWTGRGVVSQDAVWVPLTGGNTNALWQVGDLVVKRFRAGAETPLFGNDPAAERLALTALQGTGLAPELVASEGDSLVYRMAAGRGWLPEDGVGIVAQALADLHARPAPDDLPGAPGGVEVLIEQTCAMGGPDISPGAISLAKVDPVFLHGDATAANALVDSGAVTFIDWQCPALGDPCHDLAIFLSPAMQAMSGNDPLKPEQVADFLAAYGSETVTDRYLALAPLYAARMRAYCLWRAARGDAGYARAARLESETI